MEQNNKNSTATQIGTVNVYNQQITLAEVEMICKGIFWDNFTKLRDEALKVVEQRLETFSKELARRIDVNNLYKFKIPDVLYVLYQAQNAYVRVEEETIRNLIVDMIVGRISAEEKSNLQLNYNQAILLLPKLNKKHLDILTFIFFVTEIRILTLDKIKIPGDESILIEYLNFILELIDFELSANDLRYMYSVGCGTEDYFNSFEYLLTRNGTKIFKFTKKIGISEISVMPNIIINKKIMSIRKYIISLREEYEKIFETYDDKKLCNFHLSSVASLIAAKNLELKKDYKIDELKWFG